MKIYVSVTDPGLRGACGTGQQIVRRRCPLIDLRPRWVES